MWPSTTHHLGDRISTEGADHEATAPRTAPAHSEGQLLTYKKASVAHSGVIGTPPFPILELSWLQGEGGHVLGRGKMAQVRYMRAKMQWGQGRTRKELHSQYRYTWAGRHKSHTHTGGMC